MTLCMSCKNATVRKNLFQKELMSIKQVRQKNVCFAVIDFLKMLDSHLESMFVMDVMIY